MLMRAGYEICVALLLPVALLRLLWRARRQPEYLRHWDERFSLAQPSCREGAIWIHAVSVGETRAAEPLVRALRTRHPDCPILLTCTTPTGRATARQLFGDDVHVRYLPYDFGPAVRRFLRAHRPRLGILMETELWPGLMAACGDLAVPLYVVNGRLSERSARRYGYVRRLMNRALANVTAIAAQSPDDAERFRALGARRVAVCGNLKFDRAPSARDIELGGRLRARLGGRPTLVLASSREGEEQMLLDAWRVAGAGEVLLAIVPRHPQRFGAVAELVRQSGMTLQLRSDECPVATGTQVWIGDSMGEMYAYYAASDVAMIGGSFLPLGGQNLLEACAVGCPVIFGPHMFNFSEAAQRSQQAGAAIQAGAMTQAVSEALILLDQPSRRQAMGDAGRALMQAHQGATGRIIDLLGL